MKEYLGPIVCLLAMLLHPSTSLTFDLPAHILQRLDTLKAALAAESETSELVTHVLKLLVALWTHAWIPTKSHPFPDPTVVCLALMMLEPGGVFKHPKYTTGPIACMQYCM